MITTVPDRPFFKNIFIKILFIEHLHHYCDKHDVITPKVRSVSIWRAYTGRCRCSRTVTNHYQHDGETTQTGLPILVLVRSRPVATRVVVSSGVPYIFLTIRARVRSTRTPTRNLSFHYLAQLWFIIIRYTNERVVSSVCTCSSVGPRKESSRGTYLLLQYCRSRWKFPTAGDITRRPLHRVDHLSSCGPVCR